LREDFKRLGDEFLDLGIGSYPTINGDNNVLVLLRKENVYY